MPLLPHAILGPMHVHPGVVTASDYYRRQQAHREHGRRLYPGLVWPAPWRYTGAPPLVFVSGGWWKVYCVTPACQAQGDHPSFSIEWRLAICLNCGAVYEDVPVPADAAEIARLLLLRHEMWTRNWLPSETVADLYAENAAHGLELAVTEVV